MTVCRLRFDPKYAIEAIFKGIFKRCLFIPCVSYIRRRPCPFIRTDAPLTTDLQTWRTQTLSVCGSSLLTAGQWPGLAKFADFYFLIPYITWMNSEFLLFLLSCFKGGSVISANTFLSGMPWSQTCWARKSTILSYCKRLEEPLLNTLPARTFS